MHQRPRVILYARYSTDLQNPNSVRDQLTKCRAHADRQGWHVVGERADEAISGARDDRPGFNDLGRDISEGRCDIVLVESLDRLSRDQEHAARIYKDATHHDVEIHTLERGKVDAMQIGFSSTFSAVFLEDLKFKTRRGLSGRVSDGKSAGGLSYGYEIARDERGAPLKGELAIDETQAAIVRRIFQEYADGKSPLKIAAGLNEDHIPAPRSGRGGSGHWKQNTINGNRQRGTGILNNELYVGKRVWNRLRYSKDPRTNKRISKLNDPSKWETAEVPHLRIVSPELWDAVKTRQEALAQNRSTRDATDRNGLSASQGLRRRKFLLSGLLECGQCGGNMTIAGSGKVRRYYCANAKEKGRAVCDGMPGLAQHAAEGTVLSGLRDSLMQDAAYEQFCVDFEKHLRASQSSIEEDLRVRDKLIRDHEKTKANLLKAVESGTHSDVIINRLNEVDAELAEMRAGREAATPAPIDLPENLPELYRAYVEDLVGTLSEEGVVGRAADEIHRLVDRVVVRHDPELGAHELELEGSLIEMLAKAKPADAAGYRSNGSSLKLVAGAGFEPATFRS